MGGFDVDTFRVVNHLKGACQMLMTVRWVGGFNVYLQWVYATT